MKQYFILMTKDQHLDVPYIITKENGYPMLFNDITKAQEMAHNVGGHVMGFEEETGKLLSI